MAIFLLIFEQTYYTYNKKKKEGVTMGTIQEFNKENFMKEFEKQLLLSISSCKGTANTEELIKRNTSAMINALTFLLEGHFIEKETYDKCIQLYENMTEDALKPYEEQIWFEM